MAEQASSSSKSPSQSPSPSKPRNLDLPGTAGGRKLFVRNLGYRRKDEMVRLYSSFFAQFGEVEYFDVVSDHITKLPKGYGFVTFKHLESANAALAADQKDLLLTTPETRLVEVYPAQTKTMAVVRKSLAKLRADREKAAKEKKEFAEKFLKGEIVPKIVRTDAYAELSLVNRLNDDSLLLIFSLLGIRDKTRCERVCQRWNNLIMHSWAATKSLAFKEAFCLWVEDQVLDVMILYKILKKCPNLTLIDLEQTSTELDEKTCDIIGRCCPKLEKLILRDTRLNRFSVRIIGLACSKLKSIDFSKCTNISEKSLWELFHARPDLESVKLTNLENITGKCFYKLTCLSYLDLSQCSSISVEAFHKLGQNCSATLKSFIAPVLSNEGLSVICRTFRNLEVFEVEQTSETVAEIYTVAMRGARFLGKLSKLRTLKFLPELEDLDNTNLLSIIERCPHLMSLTLFGTDKLTDVSVAYLSKYCTNLRELSLEGSKISDESLRAFTHLKNLTSLKIAGSLITDEGAMYLLSNCPSLEFLSVNQCLGITLRTLLHAWDLVKESLASNQLLLEYNLNRIRVSHLASKEDCCKFEGTEVWATDEDNFSLDESEPEDDYFVDGDFESEEELT